MDELANALAKAVTKLDQNDMKSLNHTEDHKSL